MATVEDVRRKARMALILRARRPAKPAEFDGDKDGFRTGPSGKDNVPYTAAAKKIAAKAAKAPAKRLSADERAERVKLYVRAYTQGASIQQIADAAGVSYATAHKDLVTAGLQLRERGGARRRSPSSAADRNRQVDAELGRIRERSGRESTPATKVTPSRAAVAREARALLDEPIQSADWTPDQHRDYARRLDAMGDRVYDTTAGGSLARQLKDRAAVHHTKANVKEKKADRRPRGETDSRPGSGRDESIAASVAESRRREEGKAEREAAVRERFEASHSEEAMDARHRPAVKAASPDLGRQVADAEARVRVTRERLAKAQAAFDAVMAPNAEERMLAKHFPLGTGGSGGGRQSTRTDADLRRFTEARKARDAAKSQNILAEGRLRELTARRDAAAAGGYSRDTVKAGDAIKVKGTWWRVQKANDKTVQIDAGPGMEVKYRWDQVTDHRPATTPAAASPAEARPAKAAPAKAAKKAAPAESATARRERLGRAIEDLPLDTTGQGYYEALQDVPDGDLPAVARYLGAKFPAGLTDPDARRRELAHQLRPDGTVDRPATPAKAVAKKATPTRRFDANDTLRRLQSASSREEATQILGNASQADLDALQAASGETLWLPSVDRTVAQRRRAVVESLIGRDLDSSATRYGGRRGREILPGMLDQDLRSLRGDPRRQRLLGLTQQDVDDEEQLRRRSGTESTMGGRIVPAEERDQQGSGSRPGSGNVASLTDRIASARAADAAGLSGEDRAAFLAWAREHPGGSVAQWRAGRRDGGTTGIPAGEVAVIQMLAAKNTSSTDLRRLAESVGLEMPERIRAKTSMQLFLAQNHAHPGLAEAVAALPVSAQRFDVESVVERVVATGRRDSARGQMVVDEAAFRSALDGLTVAQLRQVAREMNIVTPQFQGLPSGSSAAEWADLILDRFRRDAGRWNWR